MHVKRPYQLLMWLVAGSCITSTSISAENSAKKMAKDIMKAPLTTHCPSEVKALSLVKEAAKDHGVLTQQTFTRSNAESIEITYTRKVLGDRNFTLMWDLSIPLSKVTALSAKIADEKTFKLQDKGIAFFDYGGSTTHYTIKPSSQNHCLYKAKTDEEHNVGYIGLFKNISHYSK